MGHVVTAKEEIYHALAQRLCRAPEGAVINENLMAILHRLYSESEAMVGSKFPLVPMTLDTIASITGVEQNQLKAILDEMSTKGLVVDFPRKDTFYYMLAPMIVGFFEYTFMRTGDQFHLKEMAELFESYFQSNGVMEELAGIHTKMHRTLIYETLIPVAVETEVLNYERASEIIRQSGGGAVSMCACRHEASHLGKACSAPLEVCTTLGVSADFIIRKGLGKPATVDEMLRILDQTQELGLVHLCDNVLNKPAYICHCCGCCCKVLSIINIQKISSTHPSNFLPHLKVDHCIGCGICNDKCHIKAISLAEQNDGLNLPVINNEVCIGCGVCSHACPRDALTMTRRSMLYIPPENAKEKAMRMSAEKGRD